MTTDDRQVLEVWCWVVEDDDAGARLDHFLRDQDPGPTRSQLKYLIDGGYALVDGQVARPARKLRPGQAIELCIPPPEPLSAEPEDLDLDIRHEDESLVVVNKPQGMVVHPAPGHSRGTLVNGLLFGRRAAGGHPLRPGIVHRLDKDTSGLMVVAKSEAVHADLARQFQQRTVDRRYSVLVAGSPPDQGRWSTLHGRHPTDRKRFSSRVERGKPAISDFTCVERFPGAAWLQVRLRTGRTHQVRVHCSDAGCGVLGDPCYGPRHLDGALAAIHQNLPGQALHAELLGFDHPTSGERLAFEAAPPEAFVAALAALRRLG
ncbi:MAG TPA: RluA family pseudouridine synthase [Polyangia bacterium]|nr:RluA family pseudouridine synthase [Polyangia bacterium]